MNRNYVGVLLVGMLLSGCMTCDVNNNEVRLFRTQTEYMVNSGIKSFDDGSYASALSILQSLVDNKKATKGEKVLAYKYLAFSYCVTTSYSKDTRERMCRDSFQKAFDLDPSFKLTTAEAGHPIWGPVYSLVKNKISK